jgi:hypothetical protein
MVLFSFRRFTSFLNVLGLVGLLATAATASAESVDSDPYFTISDMTVVQLKEIGNPAADPEIAAYLHGLQQNLNQASPNTKLDLTIDEIINIGKETWEIIKANKPVANVTTDQASALPSGSKAWTDFSGWKAPKAYLFEVYYRNPYGLKVVDFTYRVLYTYGGSADGKGAYLTNATIIPANLAVDWGYTFNATATIPAVTNAGTMDSPVAGMQLMMKWSVDTFLRHLESSQTYYIRGDGQFKNLSNGG